MSSKTVNRQSQMKQRHMPLLIWIILFAAFVLVANSMASIPSKFVAILSCAVCVGALALAGKRRAGLATPLVYVVTAYVLWAGLSTFYGNATSFGILEYSYLLPGFAMFLLVVLYMQRSENGFRGLANIIAWGAVPVGVFSVDAASSNVLMPLLRRVTYAFTTLYVESGSGFNNRLDTIWGNANVYAGFMSVATLLSLYLLLTAVSRKQRIAAAIVLLLNAISYLLAFSMGSLFFFFVACLAYLVFSGRGKRVPLLVIMLETALIALLTCGMCMLGLEPEPSGSLVPLLAMAVGAALLVVCDLLLRDRIAGIFQRHSKMLLVAGAILVIVLLVAVFIALNLTGPVTIEAGQTLMRSVKLPAGEYTLSCEADAALHVEVACRTEQNVLSNTVTNLAEGTANDTVIFTVPEESEAVFIWMSPEDENAGVTVSSMSYAGAAEGSVPLGYRLLPSFIANRYQELAASGTAGIRTTFFRDGLKLFAQSPIIGHGLGGFENGVQIVQQFYYETKYAHNHYVQTLCDLGIVGCALFVSFIGLGAVLLWRGRKKLLPVAAVLAACFVQMFGQALTDVIWSFCVPALVYFMLLGACAALFGEMRKEPETAAAGAAASRRRRISARAVTGVGAALGAVFCVLISVNLYTQTAFQNGELNTLDALVSAAGRDYFNRNDYMLSYVISVPTVEDDAIERQAAEYLARLNRAQSNSIPRTLATEYYQPRGEYDKMRESFDDMLAYSPSKPENWQTLFSTYEGLLDLYTAQGEENPNGAQMLNTHPELVDDALYFYQRLQEYDEQQWLPVELTAANLTFLNRLLAIADIDDVMGRINTLTTLYFDTDTAVDANQDGRPDCIDDTLGLQWTDGQATAQQDCELVLHYSYKSSANAILQIETTTPDKITAVTAEGNALALEQTENGLRASMPMAADMTTGSSDFELVITLQQGAEIGTIRCAKTN